MSHFPELWKISTYGIIWPLQMTTQETWTSFPRKRLAHRKVIYHRRYRVGCLARIINLACRLTALVRVNQVSQQPPVKLANTSDTSHLFNHRSLKESKTQKTCQISYFKGCMKQPLKRRNNIIMMTGMKDIYRSLLSTKSCFGC